MKARFKRLRNWLFRIENEVMLPFIAVGILVIAAFGAISAYSGYTMQVQNEKDKARMAFDQVNVDMLYVNRGMSREMLEEKYARYGDPCLRITDADGHVIAGEKELEGLRVVDRQQGGNRLNWTLEYLVDENVFYGDLLEKQRYVFVGAVACLLITVQVSVFLAWSLTKPVRSMSATCRQIDGNKKNWRSYRFGSVTGRRDEIGQLAKTLETLLKNLDRYTKMEYMGQVSAALAHEIKNPLAGIRSGIQVLSGRAVKDGEKLLCASMLKEIDRVTGLINNLFTLTVQRESKKEPVPLDVLVGEFGAFYGKGLPARNIAFSSQAEAGLTAWANENELRQILHNLITNSVRAIPEGSPGNISLTAFRERQEAGENRVVLLVCDDGRGMTEEELERAMEPFYTKSINGIGLGLAIVKRLSEQNGGEFTMESSPGHGTRAKLSLPEWEESFLAAGTEKDMRSGK